MAVYHYGFTPGAQTGRHGGNDGNSIHGQIADMPDIPVEPKGKDLLYDAMVSDTLMRITMHTRIRKYGESGTIKGYGRCGSSRSHHNACCRLQTETGFTLLEVLVAMLLLSMITLVAGMALRLAMGAWERGVEEGETPQLQTAVPALMAKQLNSIVNSSDLASVTDKGLLPFCGFENSLSFFTSYAPQGSPWQGVLRVTYRFDEERDTLLIYEQVITQIEDLKEELNPLSEKWDQKIEPIGRATGIKKIQFLYTDQKKTIPDESDKDKWRDKWACGMATHPALLKLRMNTDTKDPEKDKIWYLPVGPSAL